MSQYVVTAIFKKDGGVIDYFKEEFDCINDENAIIQSYQTLKEVVVGHSHSGWKQMSIVLTRKDGSENILVPCSWIALSLALGDWEDAREQLRRLKSKK